MSIEYRIEAGLATGRFQVHSAAVADVVPANAPLPLRVRRANLVVEVNGVRHPLSPPGLVIGRGTDADLRINDPGISRRHARINVKGTGDDQQLTIEDLGSTNGIMVDGQRVRTANLDEGSRIDIGSTRLLILSPTGNE